MRQRFYISMLVAVLLLGLLYACKNPSDHLLNGLTNVPGNGFDLNNVKNDYAKAMTMVSVLKVTGKDKRDKTNKRKLRWNEAYTIETPNGQKMIVPFSLEEEIFILGRNRIYDSYGASSFFIVSKNGTGHDFEIATYVEDEEKSMADPSAKWSGQVIVEDELGNFVKAVGIENGAIVSEGSIQGPNGRTLGYDCRLVEYFSCAYIPDIGYYAPCQYMYSTLFCYYVMPASIGNSNGYLTVVGGIQSSSGGGASTDNNPYYPLPDRLSNLVRFNNLTASMLAQINAQWDLMFEKSCALRALYVGLTSRNAKLDIRYDPNLSPSLADAFYDPVGNKMYFKSQSFMTEDIVMEEFFHKFQNAYYSGGTTQYTTNGHVNIEFEVALFQDIMAYIHGWPDMPTIPTDEYSLWIDEITQGGTKFPTTFGPISAEYFNYLGLYDTTHPNVAGTTSQSLTPGAMFEIFNSSSCPK
ncbi:hypothetical protein [Dyadobacter pollutisoli]|uniref:Lipoprotein n=1 Tax=Dyadobacter pollutisoli TaxID=2910158 RepID=A0A9E8N9L9_9BACT|nr:hypothetical protein [Dyadobacter pollutisoli]WAC12425.1 hypothetical protein ON006_00395 [Dyadobacter pollutisoli]